MPFSVTFIECIDLVLRKTKTKTKTHTFAHLHEVSSWLALSLRRAAVFCLFEGRMAVTDVCWKQGRCSAQTPMASAGFSELSRGAGLTALLPAAVNSLRTCQSWVCVS